MTEEMLRENYIEGKVKFGYIFNIELYVKKELCRRETEKELKRQELRKVVREKLCRKETIFTE